MCWSGQVDAQDWSVRNRGRRHRVVFQRFVKLVEARPERGFAFRRMVKLARYWPGLDRLLSQYKAKVKRKPNRVAYRLIWAHLLYVTRQRQRALEVYQEVVKRSPNNLLGHIYVADLYRKLRKAKSALKAYTRAFALSKKRKDKQRCLKAMGTLALQLKQPQRALGYWNQFLRLRPGDLSAREEIARAMARQKLFREAQKQWNQILKRSRGSAKKSRVLRQIGLVYEQSGSWQKAVVVYRKSMSYTRSGHWLRRELNERVLQLHRENGKLGDLVAFLKKKRRKSKSELAMIARLLDELGRDREAAKAYQVALRRSPQDTKLRRKYITLLEVRSKMKEAIRQYQLLIRREPREPRHRLAFSEMLSRMGKRRESMKEMRSIARLFSRNTEILNRLARLYRKRRMMREALSLYKRLIRLEPREASHRRALGRYYYQNGKERKAKRIWRGILSSGMPSHKAYLALGQILREHGLLRDARKWYDKARRSRPRNMSYLTQLGELYQRILDEEGQLPPRWLTDAIKIWKKIYKKARLRSRRKRSMQQLFAFYHAQGTLYRLPRQYLQRTRKNPRDVEALRWLGEHELWKAQRRGRRSFFQARHYFRRILKVRPKDLDAILTLEQLAARSRQWHNARKLLLVAVKVHRAGRRSYYRRICDYSLKMRANRDAIKYARKAIALNPEDASAHADLARIYRKAGKARKAIAAYREAIRLRPNSHSYSLALADLMRKQGQLRQAARLYRHVYKHSKDGRAIYESALYAVEILLPLGEGERLESELQSMADANPRELAYFRALAELYRRQGKMKAYRIAYLKAAATVDQKSQVYKQLAQVAQEQGDLPKAIIYFRKMLEESPNPAPREQIKLANFYLQTNDKVNARKILLSLLNEHPNSLRVLRQVAALLDKYNLHKEAIQAYEQFLNLDPQSPSTRIRLAHLYQKRQQYQAAIGLLNAVVWGYYDRPVRRKKAVVKKRSKTRRRLPYYMRRFRRSRRYRMSLSRRQAMVQLMKIYKKLGMLSAWERRVVYALGEPRIRRFRYYMIRGLIRYYQQNRWFNRLQGVLEEMRRQEPRNILWTQYLAEVYRRQGRFSDALVLYQKMEQVRPGTRNRNFVAKLNIALEMKDKARVRYLVQEFLHRQVGSNLQTQRVLRLLKRHQYYGMLEKMLKWGLKYGKSYYYANYIRELIAVYLKVGKREQARELLWREWHNPSQGLYTRSSMGRVMRQRQQLVARLWPLLTSKQKQFLLRNKEQELLERLIAQRRKLWLRRSLIDLYALMEVSQGVTIAQKYLPSLWVLTGRSYSDRAMRQQIMKKLLQQGEFEVSKVLIQQSLKRQKSSEKRLFFLLQMLSLLSRYQLFPPRAFSRFFERQLRNLRTKVGRGLWRHVAIELADRYLAWGDYQRVIWWVALCQWTAPESQRGDHRLLLRLARAYQRKGKERLAKRSFAKVTKLLWQQFAKHPEGSFDRARIRSRLAYARRFLLRRYSSYRMRRYKQLLRRYNAPRGKRRARIRYRRSTYRRRYRSRFSSIFSRRSRRKKSAMYFAKFAILELYNIHAEAGEKDKLFRRLRRLWERTSKPRLREYRLFYLIASYRMDWTKQRNTSSLHALIKLLRGLLPRYPLPRKLTLHTMLAELEAEAGQYKRALASYFRILKHAKKRQKFLVMRRIAGVYERAGDVRRHRRIRIKLANQHKDRISDKWLADYYLEKRRYSNAIRYYQRYLRRGGKSRRRYRSYSRMKKVNDFLKMAQFLMPTGNKQRILYFLLRATGTLRVEGSTKNYTYRSYMQRIMNLMLRIGRLRSLAAKWEKRRTQNTQDLHLLSMLRYAYRTLEMRDKQRQVVAQMISIRPYDLKLLTALLGLCQRSQAFKEGLTLLKKLYKARTPKPKAYHLWVGRFYHRLGQNKQAFASWKREAEACERLSSRYQRHRCQMTVGEAFLKASGVQEALRIYRRTFRQHTYRYRWMLTNAAQLFLKKRAYKEALSFVEAAQVASPGMTLNKTRVMLMGVQVEAYKGLGWKKQSQELLRQLERASYSDYYAAQQAGALLEKNGSLLSAEKLFWRGLQQARNKWARARSFRTLCGYWQRQALGRLCRDEEPENIGKFELKQSFLLAHRFSRAGFPFLALLQLRKLRLVSPNKPTLWKRLFELSVEVGRWKEARLWLRRLEQAALPPKQLKAMQRKLQKARGSTPAVRLPSHRSWPAISIPTFCRSVRIVGGKLQGQKCENAYLQYRCSRKLLHHKGILVTNDCMGRFFGIDTSKGKVLWMYSLPKLRLGKNATLRRLPGRTKIRQFYRVAGLKVTRQGDVVFAVNHNWFAMSSAWSSGVHHQLHLGRLDLQTGKLIWKRAIQGGFARGQLSVLRDTVALLGRTFEGFRVKDGKSLWRHSAGKHASAWLYGSKDHWPHVASSRGVVVAGWDKFLYHYSSTGQLLWRKRFPRHIMGLASKGNHLIAVASETLYSLDLKTGKVLWKVTDELSPAMRQMSVGRASLHYYLRSTTPVLSGNRILYVGNHGFFVARALSTGAILWRRKMGDHGPHPVGVDPLEQVVGFMGEEGTLSTLRLSDGKLHWRYTFSPQIYTTSTRRYLRETHSPVWLGKQQIWVGSYDRLNRFSVHGFLRKSGSIHRRMGRLRSLIESLRKERRSQLALHALTHAIDRSDSSFRPQFLLLSQHRRSSLQQKLWWGYRYLAAGHDFASDLKRLLSGWSKLQPSINTNKYHPSGSNLSHALLMRLIVLLHHSNPSMRALGRKAWIRLCSRSGFGRLRMLANPVGRRFASEMLKRKSRSVQLLAALSLSVWGDREGRRPFLKLLASKKKFRESSMRRILRLGVHLLFSWDARMTWTGSVTREDIPYLKPLLQHSNASIRLSVALFFAHIASESLAWRKLYATPKVLKILNNGARSFGRKAILSSLLLARLGNDRGLQRLRQMYDQSSGYTRIQIARALYNEFQDFWGLKTLLATYRGRNRSSLKLASFRIIYGNRLLALQRYNGALYQFQMVQKFSSKLLSSQHRAMALYGIARCLFFLKRYKLAQAKFEEALRLDEYMTHVYGWLGRLAYRQKRYQRARSLLEKALYHLPYHEAFRQLLATTYFHLGKSREAHKLFADTIKSRPDEFELHASYARALLLAPKPLLRRALGEINKALKHRANFPNYLYIKAQVLFKLGKQKESREFLQAAVVREAPTSPYQKRYIKLYKKWFKRMPALHSR